MRRADYKSNSWSVRTVIFYGLSVVLWLSYFYAFFRLRRSRRPDGMPDAQGGLRNRKKQEPPARGLLLNVGGG